MQRFTSGGFSKQHWWLTPFTNPHLWSNNIKTGILESFVIDWESHDCESDLCICLLQVWKPVWPRRVCSQAVTYQPFTTYRPLNGFGRAFPLNQTSLQMRMSNLDAFFYNLRLLYNRCLRYVGRWWLTWLTDSGFFLYFSFSEIQFKLCQVCFLCCSCCVKGQCCHEKCPGQSQVVVLYSGFI